MPLLPLYATALFLSAALLFTVQPLFARLVLPVLGGAPAVWGTTQVFFQTALLAGYAYAHLSVRALGVRRQARAHLVVPALALLALPIGLGRASAPPVGASPVPWLLGAMVVTVGPPFFALAATGPLLQRWFSATGHPRAADPYFLYAASNLGSLLGLAAYPTIVEPALGLWAQTRAWTWLYGALSVLLAACALFVKAGPVAAAPPEASLPAPSAPARSPREQRRRIGRWVALSFVPSSLSLAATTLLTEDVGATPLLWILPLSIYLLTFVLAFSARPLVPHGTMVTAAPAAIVLGVLAAAAPIAGPTPIFLAVILGALFVIAMVCHGELARSRPAATELTGFFFWISLGGALGGAFTALLCPLLFQTVVEYSVTLAAAAFLLPERPEARAQPLSASLATAALAAVACAVGIAGKRRGFLVDPVAVTVVLAALAFFLLVAAPRSAALGAALGVVLIATQVAELRTDGVLRLDRSFFGSYRVTEPRTGPHLRNLYHGATLHGVQATEPPEMRAEPLSYYSVEGPVGQLFLHGPVRPDARVAVVGLGIGTLLTYAQPEQRWTFYEIDPKVVEIAEDRRLFTYLSEGRAPHRVELGDARRRMAAATETYTLILLDAYSSDAVPVHLLTREAIEVYLAHLEEGGLLALHISNRHLDLVPVVAAAAVALGLTCVEQNAAVTPSAAAQGKSSAHWALLARRREDLGALADDSRWHAPPPKLVPWADDRASLLQVWSAW